MYLICLYLIGSRKKEIDLETIIELRSEYRVTKPFFSSAIQYDYTISNDCVGLMLEKNRGTRKTSTSLH